MIMASDPLEVIVYENGEHIRDFLNAIAAFAGDGIFETILYVAMLAGLLSVVTVLLMKQSFEHVFQWMVSFVIVIGVLVGPKTSVIVVDRTDPGMPGGVVANVPYSVAVISSFSTKIGDKMAQSYETLMGIPEQQKFTQHGLFWSAHLVRSMDDLRISDARVRQNVQEYMKACMFANIGHDATKAQNLQTSGDLAEFFTGGFAARSLYYTDATNARSAKTCAEAGPLINAEVDAQTATSGDAFKGLAKVLFPDQSTTEAATTLSADAALMGNEFFGISRTGSQMIKQMVLLNEVIPSAAAQAAGTGDSEIMNYVNARAQTQSRISMGSLGRLMNEMLPITYTIIFAILIGVFPIVMALAVIPGGGLNVVKNWLMGFIVIQTWPIFFVLINRFIMKDAIDKMQAMTLQADGTQALTLENMGVLTEVPTATAAQAGGLMALIPVLSFVLFKSVSMLGGQLESMLRPVHTAAEAASADAAVGNISHGNYSGDRANYQEVTANNWSTSTAVDQTAEQFRRGDGTIAKRYGGRPHETVYDTSQALQRTAFASSMRAESGTHATMAISEAQSRVEDTMTRLSENTDRIVALAQRGAERESVGSHNSSSQSAEKARDFTVAANAVVSNANTKDAHREFGGSDSKVVSYGPDGGASLGKRFGAGKDGGASDGIGGSLGLSGSVKSNHEAFDRETDRVGNADADTTTSNVGISDRIADLERAVRDNSSTLGADYVKEASDAFQQRRALTQELSERQSQLKELRDTFSESRGVASSLSVDQSEDAAWYLRERYGSNAEQIISALSPSEIIGGRTAQDYWEEAHMFAVVQNAQELRAHMPVGPSTDLSSRSLIDADEVQAKMRSDHLSQAGSTRSAVENFDYSRQSRLSEGVNGSIERVENFVDDIKIKTPQGDVISRPGDGKSVSVDWSSSGGSATEQIQEANLNYDEGTTGRRKLGGDLRRLNGDDGTAINYEELDRVAPHPGEFTPTAHGGHALRTQRMRHEDAVERHEREFDAMNELRQNRGLAPLPYRNPNIPTSNANQRSEEMAE